MFVLVRICNAKCWKSLLDQVAIFPLVNALCTWEFCRIWEYFVSKVSLSTRNSAPCMQNQTFEVWWFLFVLFNVWKMRFSLMLLVLVNIPVFHTLASFGPFWATCWLWLFHAMQISFRKEKHLSNAAGV